MSQPMTPGKRHAYSAIVDRPVLKLPNDGRIIVWTIVNLEVWDISRPMARQVIPAPTGQVLLPGNGLPYVFCQMKKQIGVEDVAKFLFSSGGL